MAYIIINPIGTIPHHSESKILNNRDQTVIKIEYYVFISKIGNNNYH